MHVHVYTCTCTHLCTLTKFIILAHNFILFTEPTGFIIAVGNDPDSYKGSQPQLSLPKPDKQWYKKSGHDVGKGSRVGNVVGTDSDKLKLHLLLLHHSLLYLKLILTDTSMPMKAKGVKQWIFAQLVMEMMRILFYVGAC